MSLWILAIQSFTDLIASECQGGRMVGPVPTVTNERYMLIDIITIPPFLALNRPYYFKPNNSTDDLANVCFQTIPSDLCQIRYLPYTQILIGAFRPTKRRLAKKTKQKRRVRQLERTAGF